MCARGLLFVGGTSERQVGRMSAKDHKKRLLDLLHRAGQLVDEQFAHYVGSSKITSRQYVVLAAIAQNEGHSQTTIVNATGMDRSTVAEMVARLVKRDWLRRRRRKEDLRAYAVNLTAAGRKALRTGQRAAHEADGNMLAALSTPRREQFLKALTQIVVERTAPQSG
jgi:DNA-binding MarR family transcriptional regulator